MHTHKGGVNPTDLNEFGGICALKEDLLDLRISGHESAVRPNVCCCHDLCCNTPINTSHACDIRGGVDICTSRSTRAAGDRE